MKAKGNGSWIRSPAVAGRFYPDDPSELKDWLTEHLPPSPAPAPEKTLCKGIFAPHAGYVFSGKVAADVYRRVKIPPIALVLCPNHTGKGSMVSVWADGEWETPLGSVPVDKALADEILGVIPGAGPDRLAHQREHAIEVHLPFLKHLNPEVKIVPIVFGPLRKEACLDAGKAIAKILSARSDVLVVASTDMSHYIPADVARVKDKYALDAIEQGDAAGLYREVTRHDISMCGFIPTTVGLESCRLLGAERFSLLSYATSGDVTGDNSSVVAYASGTFF